ncbi:MAG: ABC transporter substrate-binding protein [Proteobacteria bacterium]|nr:ABC transporter substrate-binding protein [Pseudomonadota bacterium]
MAAVQDTQPGTQITEQVPPSQSTNNASQFVRQLGELAADTLRKPGTNLKDREARLHILLLPYLDLSPISRYMLGRHYRRLSSEERSNYQEAFNDYVLQLSSVHLGGYVGEKLTVVSERLAEWPRDTTDIVVRTRVDRPSGSPAAADWRIRIRDNRYQIIDIVVEGTSVGLTREEIFAAFQRGGIEQVIAMLRQRTAAIQDTQPAALAAEQALPSQKTKLPIETPVAEAETLQDKTSDGVEIPGLGIRIAAHDSGNIVITDVEPSGTAAQKGLRPGDLIVEINQEKVISPADAAEKIDLSGRGVLLLVAREGDYQWVSVQIDRTKNIDWTKTQSAYSDVSKFDVAGIRLLMDIGDVKNKFPNARILEDIVTVGSTKQSATFVGIYSLHYYGDDFLVDVYAATTRQVYQVNFRQKLPGLTEKEILEKLISKYGRPKLAELLYHWGKPDDKYLRAKVTYGVVELTLGDYLLSRENPYLVERKKRAIEKEVVKKPEVRF